MQNVHQYVAQRGQRPLFIGVLVALALALGGCGSIKLHSDVRQKQGEDLSKAWKEVDLKPLFDAERANQAKLLEAETTAWHRNLTDQYDSELRLLAKEPVGGYRTRYLQSLTSLVGPVTLKSDASNVNNAVFNAISQNIGTALASATSERVALQEATRAQSILKSQQVPAFSCGQMLDKQEIVAAWRKNNVQAASSLIVTSALRSLETECKNIEKHRKQYSEAIPAIVKEQKKQGAIDAASPGGPTGRLMQRVDTWNADAVALNQRLATVDDATIALNKAQKAYDDSIVTGKSLSDDAKAKAKQLAGAANALAAAQDAFGIEIASQDRIKRIDALLESLQDGVPLSTETASRLEVAISLFPNIADALQAVKDQKAGTASMPLLIQRDVELSRLSSARVEAARQQQRVALRATLVHATLTQTGSVLRAIQRLNAVSPKGKDLLQDTAEAAYRERAANEKVLNDPQATEAAKSAARASRDRQTAAMLDALWGSLSGDDRRFVLDSTVFYLDAHRRHEIHIQKVDTARLALSMERNVDLAEVNAKLWVALLNSTVSQAAEYSALGFKASDFEKIFNFAALGYIGHGVNK